MGEHIQVEIVCFDVNDEECIAIMNGLEIRVDPFVGITSGIGQNGIAIKASGHLPDIGTMVAFYLTEL